jgi:hypothetical protein
MTTTRGVSSRFTYHGTPSNQLQLLTYPDKYRKAARSEWLRLQLVACVDLLLADPFLLDAVQPQVSRLMAIVGSGPPSRAER